MRKTYSYWLWVLAICVLSCSASKINRVEFQDWPSQIHIYTSAPTEASVFTMSSPHRVVVDVPGRCGPLPKKPSHSYKHVRQGQHENKCRLVFETSHRLSPILYTDNNQKKTVVAFQDSERDAILAMFNDPTPMLKRFVVAIDAGHGGKDPGAIGLAGSHEKAIVLKLAMALKQEIEKDARFEAFLTRTRDQYVPLRQRTSIARKQKADIFVSIHADAFKNKRAHGASVYVLSEKGASSEAAKWLAQHENEADLVSGLSLDEHSPQVASMLLDLSQSATQEDSEVLAAHVLDSLREITPLHKPTVERAGFAVLKSPDVPSILIEAGFISNKYGERRLNSRKYQRQFAIAVKSAIERYFQTRAWRHLAQEEQTSDTAR